MKELNKSELISINGGSELTNAIWYGYGATVGYFETLWGIWSDGIEQMQNGPR